MRFPTSYEPWRDLYLLQVEGSVNGLQFAARCYLKSIMGNVEAIILGGQNRLARQGETIWMNGSLSYDFSKRRGDIQFSNYNWNCYSADDIDNPFCHRNISSVAVFSIPAKSFKSGCRYTFRLQVFRDGNPNVSSQKMQAITVIEHKILEVTIECVRNCRNDFFTPSSKIHLRSKCANCGGQLVRYKWFVDGQLLVTSRDLALYIRSAPKEIRIKLIVYSKYGIYGRKVKTLFKNTGPRGGVCSVYPKQGYEAITPFYPCCQNFVSLNGPKEYWYYAGSVLVGSCVDCNCEIYLPVTSSIKVLVCDVAWACRTIYMEVKIIPLRRIPHNIHGLLEKGLMHRYLQTIQSAASHLTKAESGLNLTRNLTTIPFQSRSSLARLANLTLTLAHRLYFVDEQKESLLTRMVRIMNNNLEQINRNEGETFLVEKPFNNLRLACRELYEIIKRLCKKTPRPPMSVYDQYQRAFSTGKLDQSLVEKLVDKTQKLAKDKSNTPWIMWLNSTWEMERLYRHLNYHSGIYRSDIIDPRKEMSKGVALEIQCFDTFPKKIVRVLSSDKIHMVLFSRAVLKEVLKTDEGRVCLKLVSMKLKLNWWYPINKKPSTLVLSVRIYQREDNFTVQIPLNRSQIHMKTFITYDPEVDSEIRNSLTSSRRYPRAIRFSSTEIKNCLREGTLQTRQEVRMYRMVLMEHTLLAVHFTTSTHKLQVVLRTKHKPSVREISNSKCTIPALTTNATLLLRNNCHKADRAYIALRLYSDTSMGKADNSPIPNGPARFAFVFQIRSCDTWQYSASLDNQKWLHYGCYPTMDLSVERGIRCTCTVLGTYTDYLYYIPGVEVPIGVFQAATLSILIILLYLAVLLIILLWILWLYKYRNKLPSKTILFPKFELEDESTGELHDVMISLRTGGRINSGTTASVHLSFLGQSQPVRHIAIKQDPENIFLKPNTTLYIWVRTRDIRIPTKVMVYHNNAGRFPRWFLRRIEVTDIQTGQTQVFLARKWLEKGSLLMSSTLIYRQGDVRMFDVWKNRFLISFEMYWINWSLWQPVTGSWRESVHYPRMSRAKRFCEFICKLLVNYTICASFFGVTTSENLHVMRSLFLNYKDIIILTMICSFVDLILQTMFDLVNYKFG
ncbi:uncharacterized protein LOC6734145 isoform X2 [Drosophila simulans]|nr:uncharacterized protein LOC6734145 isoform X2 [Drosophila simulans]KMY93185.1 uncharacterized protein Dsimw501_GD10875, isoform C [Drosophila simulans]